jgi:ATP-dependent DNA helicase RecG
MMAWKDPIGFVPGLAPRTRKLLATLGIETVGDLLALAPRRYDDFSQTVPIAMLPDGQPVTARGVVAEIGQVRTFRRGMVIVRATIKDQSGSIDATWFNQPWLLKTLTVGREILLAGTVSVRPRMGRGFTSPTWEPADGDVVAAGMVAPVYPLTAGLAQKTMRQLVHDVLPLVELPADPLPASILARLHLPSWPETVRKMHAPATLAEAESARRRRAFGELFVYQLLVRQARADADRKGAPKLDFDQHFAKAFVAKLPFELTDDQKKAVWTAVKDMETGRPMRRLLQGDVGSGKTAVGAMLAALSWRAGGSAALMAPTDLLAKQHAETFRRFLLPHGIPVLLITGSTRMLWEAGEEKKLSTAEARERIAEGRLVAVGTHALLTPGQSPPDLVLAVVDEQHRFGVSQREALAVAERPDGKVPHLLSMSATPIPRSLALTLHGDLDISIIRAKPKGRRPIETIVGVGEYGREQAYDRIREEVAQKHRAFVVCPLVDPSDVLGVKSVQAEVRRLATGPLRGMRIGMVHGKMPAKEKDEEMRKFAAGELDILVATTVIEVGVDVPEATVILVEGAERFGLAQLHQLRGRVGRSALASYCLLVASDDAGATRGLRVLESTTDGFVVAEEDLRIRGEGDLFGTQQSGEATFPSVRTGDVDLMSAARDEAMRLLEEDPKLARHPALQEEIARRHATAHRE